MVGRTLVGLDLAQQLRTAHQCGFGGNEYYYRRVSGYVPGVKRDGKPRRKMEGITMTKLRILGAVALAVLMTAPDAVAQRRGGGGAVSGGMRGAVVGGMVGGESGAATGAKIGAVTGATRGVAQRTAKPQCHVCGNPSPYPIRKHCGLSECPALEFQRSAAGGLSHFRNGYVARSQAQGPPLSRMVSRQVKRPSSARMASR